MLNNYEFIKENIDGIIKEVIYWNDTNIFKKTYKSSNKIVVDEYPKEDNKNILRGRFYNLEKLIYEGEMKFIDGRYRFDGFGRKIISEEIYKGEFKNGYFHGRGTLENSKTKKRYEGEFKFSSYDGFGKLYEDNLLMYEGEFKYGYKHGFGKEYYYIIENKFILTEGCFFGDKYNGFIEVKDYDGSIISRELYLSGEKIFFNKESGYELDLENISSKELIKIFAEKAAFYKDKCSLFEK
jgi:hypothetical protein